MYLFFYLYLCTAVYYKNNSVRDSPGLHYKSSQSTTSNEPRLLHTVAVDFNNLFVSDGIQF